MTFQANTTSTVTAAMTAAMTAATTGTTTPAFFDVHAIRIRVRESEIMQHADKLIKMKRHIVQDPEPAEHFNTFYRLYRRFVAQYDNLSAFYQNSSNTFSQEAGQLLYSRIKECYDWRIEFRLSQLPQPK